MARRDRLVGLATDYRGRQVYSWARTEPGRLSRVYVPIADGAAHPIYQGSKGRQVTVPRVFIYHAARRTYERPLLEGARVAEPAEKGRTC